MKFKQYIFILFSFALFFNNEICLFGQNSDISFIQNYPISVYEGDPQNWCIAEDHRGVMYFANQNGFILEYDGSNWRKIDISGLASVRSLAIDSLGTIFVGTIDDFGYLAPDIQGNIEYVSLMYLLDSSNRNFGEVWSICINKDEVFFQAWETLFRLKNNKIKTWRLTELYHRSFVIHNKFYVRQERLGITVLEGDSLKLINGGELFAEETISAMIPFTEKKILIGTRKKGLYIYDPDNIKQPISKFKSKVDDFLSKNMIYHGITIDNDKFAFATLLKGIIIINNKGEILKEINKSHSLLSVGAYFLYKQNEKILWIAHENGISKILLNSPFQFLNESIGSAINDITRYKEKLYLATDQGAVYIDSTGNLSPKHVHQIDGISGMTWRFLHVKLPANYNGNGFTNKLLLATTEGLYEIDNNRAILIKKLKTIFCLHTAKKDSTIIYTGFKDGIYAFKWNYKSKSWTDFLILSDINSEIRYIEEDNENSIWISSMYNGIYRIIPSKIKIENNEYVPDYTCRTPFKIDYFTVKDGLPSDKGNICSSFQGNIVFPSDNGLYKYNKSNNKFTLDSSIHPILAKKTTAIFRFKESSDGNIWIDSDMIFYKQSDRSFIIDTLSLKKINDKRIDAVYPEDNGIIWFGGDGLYRYDMNIKLKLNKSYPSLIRKVTLNKDSIIFGGANFDESNRVCIEQSEILIPIIDYKFNSLSFEYTAIFFEDEKNLQYSYMLENFDNKWSQWSPEIKKEYTNLFEGEYIFKVKAKNVYDIESSIATYSFEILPPVSRTSWAYILYVMLFGFIIYSAIRINARRLKAANIHLEEQVKERTEEILYQKNEIELQSKELAKLSIVASETDNAITIMDANGNIEWFNNAYAELFGYTFDEFVKEKGKNIRDTSSYENIEEVIADCIQHKKSVIYETLGTTKTRGKAWTQTTITPILNEKGNIIKLVSIEADIERIKKFEEELIQMNEEISAQRDALAEANATKDKFFSIISHDLKSPFNAILGFSELLSENYKKIKPERGEIFIKQIFESSKQAFNLVENLLQWSRAKTDKIKSSPEKLDLKEVITSVTTILELSIIEKSIELQTDIKNDLFVFADIDLLSMIIRNLITNAIKFTNPEGCIKISTKKQDEFIKISICDNGLGINKKDIKKLFREDIHFTTRGTNQEKGTGLGLILCKEFVEKSGGEIWVESELGIGSTFHFTVPFYK